MSKSFDYVKHIEEILKRVQETQWEAIDKCARQIAQAIAGRHSVFAFGASHAGILAQEMFYRTGGIAVLNAILPSEFMLNTRPVTQTSAMERLEGYPRIILEHTPIQSGDMLLLHSVSGRNTAAIEMAIEAKKWASPRPPSPTWSTPAKSPPDIKAAENCSRYAISSSTTAGTSRIPACFCPA